MALEPTLMDLFGQSVEDTLIKISRDFLTDKLVSFNDYSDKIESFKRQLCSIPSSHHEKLSVHCLKAADRLTDEFSNNSAELVSRNQYMIQRIVSMITHLSLKRFHLSGWSKPVQEILLHFLWRMTHLETIDSSSWDELIHLQPRLVESLPFLTNLTSFTMAGCTDEIIAAICENCPNFTDLNTRTNSPEITDKCIDSLILCKNLEDVELTVTGVTDAGLVKLFLKSCSKNLKHVNYFGYFSGNFLELLKAEAAPSETFQLRKFEGVDGIDCKQVPLISKYFPFLVSLSLDCGQAEFPDYSCLDCLKHLEQLELCIYRRPEYIYSTISFEQLNSLRSQNLTSLDFYNWQVLSITGLFDIGVHCPNLTSLSLRDCSVLKDMDSLTASLRGKPFQKLQKLVLRLNSSASGVELLLMHATNIKTIFLSASNGLTDALVTKIFRFNQLAKLKSLYILSKNEISGEMLKSIIQRCEKIENLGKFAPPDDSDAEAKDEFECLQKFITTENKYNVKLV